MNKMYGREWSEKIESGNRNILYFPKDISTATGLAKVKRHNFICGYHYTLQINGTTMERALFYNHKNDLLSLRYTEDKFFYSNEGSRLYIYRMIQNGDEQQLKALPPINPFNEHALTKSIIPDNATPLQLEDFEQVFQNERYLFPENSKIEMYKRQNKRHDNHLESVLRLANRYLFAETYSNFDDYLKQLYKPLLDMHMELFYEDIADILEVDTGELIISEVLSLLNITLDYDYLANKIKEKERLQLERAFVSKSTLLNILKSQKKKIIEGISPIKIINRHTEWFKGKQSLENPSQIIMAKAAI